MMKNLPLSARAGEGRGEVVQPPLCLASACDGSGDSKLGAGDSGDSKLDADDGNAVAVMSTAGLPKPCLSPRVP